MSFEEKLAKLRKTYQELSVLSGLGALVGWDEQVYMPVASAGTHARMSAYLSGLGHDISTSPELGQLLSDLQAEAKDLPEDDDIVREIKVAKRAYDKMVRIPKDKMIEFVMATSAAHEAWLKAKVNNDYPSFEPHLARIIDLQLEMVDYFKPWDHPYDALLDLFEPGMKTVEVRAIFEALRPQQVDLIQQIVASQPVEDAFLNQQFDIAMQRKLGQHIAGLIGYDWSRGRLDETEHPFTTGFSLDDVRITTHYYPNDLLSAFFSTMHETGHALYDLGINRKYEGTSLVSTASMALHESQSRLWENMVGRSKPFWKFYYPTLQAFFPDQLGNVDVNAFYRGVNKVTPSLVRIEADEVTYNLHIMLRMELELALIEKTITTKDLPEAWNARMRGYLGITPPTDTLGVLQDVHWAGGSIGYFPTYALGNLVAAQFWHKLNQDQPDIPDQMASGNFAPILAWLRVNVHRHGGKYTAQELVRQVTGQGINPAYYMKYLTDKYKEIYNF